MASVKSSRRCGIDNCRSRRYHIGEDGFTYCENSHRQDVGLVIGEDDYRQGASQSYAETTRLRREKTEAVKIYLEGREGMILYLQCFQFILWKQITWLINVKHYPKELEVVVRDMWTLRMHLLRSTIESLDDQRASQIFSTQSETEDTDVENTANSASQTKLYQRAPRLVETLVLCYLSLNLLHIPVHSGKFKEWILCKDFIYLKALRDLPSSMKTRLHPKMRYSLDSRTGEADLEGFHKATLRIAIAFKHSFDMKFPAMNHHLLLFQFISALGLPLDLFSITENLVRLLNLEFTYAAGLGGKKRKFLLSEHPEISLLCTMVIAVKLVYPFDSGVVTRNPAVSDTPAADVVNWDAWNDARKVHRAAVLEQASLDQKRPRSTTPSKPPRGALNGSNLDSEKYPWLTTTEHDAMHMTPSDIDAYLSWFNETLIDLPRDENGRETGERWFFQTKNRSAVAANFRLFLFETFPTTAPPTDDEQETAADEMEIDSDSDVNSLYEDDQPPSGPVDNQAKAHVERIEAVQKSLQHRTPIPETKDKEEGVLGKTGRTLNATKMVMDQLVRRPGSLYRHYRITEEIPACAELFFEDAAALVGLKTAELVRALFQMENVMKSWVGKQRGKSYSKSARAGNLKTDEPYPREPGEEEDSDM